MRQHKVDRDHLRELVRSFNRARVTVIGDIIVDHYIWGRVQRISPEAPVPVVEVRDENRRLGGAANVAHNIARLGGKVDLVGAVGLDEAGDWLAAELADRGIDTEGVVRLPGRQTTVKTRIVAHSQQVVRVDRETREHLPARALTAFKGYLERRLSPGRVVVVSDYGKGVVSPPLLEFLRTASRRRGLSVCVDPKSRHFTVYRGFTLVTPNQREAETAANMEIHDQASLRKAGAKLMGLLHSKALLITRGEQGMSLFSGRDVSHIPTAAKEVYDVTGAGDTVLATLSLGLAVGASFLEAAILANLAAGIVVGEVGTSTVERQALLRAIKNVGSYIENRHS